MNRNKKAEAAPDYPETWNPKAPAHAQAGTSEPDFSPDETSASYAVDDGYWYPVNVVSIRTNYSRSGTGNWCLSLQMKIADAGQEETRGFAGRRVWANFTLARGAMFNFNSVLMALGHTQDSVRSDIIHQLKTQGVELANDDKAKKGWEGLNEKVPILAKTFLGQPLRVLVDKKKGRDKQEVLDYGQWPEGSELAPEDDKKSQSYI